MVVALVVVAAACDWTTVGFDASRSGWNAPDTALTPANVATLTQKWTAALGSTSGSDPVVVGGKVFASSSAVDATAGALRSFDAKGVTGCTGPSPATCTPLWSVDYPPGDIFPNLPTTVSAPTVTGGIVAVGLQTLHRFGGTAIAAYNAGTGAPAFSATGGGYPSLAAASGRIFASVTAIGQRSPAFISVTYLAAVDAVTGATHFVATNESGSSFSDPAIANGGLFAVAGGGVLQAFDAAGSTGCSQFHSPAWPDNIVFAPKFCYPLWSATLPNASYARPTVANGLVYVGDSAGTVSAFRAAGCGAPTCAAIWTGQAGTSASTLAVTGTSVFVGSSDGHLYAFPAKGCGKATCSPTWTATTGPAVGAPSIAGSVLFVGSSDGHLRAFGANGCGKQTCTPLWDTNVGTPLRGAPAVSDGRVFVTDTAGTLHAYGLP